MQLTLEQLHMASRHTIPGLDLFLTRKYNLAKTLARATDLATKRGQGPLFDIAPRAFVFPGDFEAWLASATAQPGTIWIAKPGDGARGEGIFLVTDIAAVKPVKNLVLQEYIANPHLLGGYKYTLRFFVAVTSLDPLRAWVFPDGLAKLATQPFTTDRASLDNLFIHLTNPGVLRGDTTVDFTTQRMTHSDYRKRLQQDGLDDKHLFQQIHTIIAKSLLAVREPVLHFNARHNSSLDGQFMLLGYDILVDANLCPWVIEVNAGPSLEADASDTHTGRQEQAIKQQVATDMLVLADRLPKAKVKFQPLFPSAATADWLPCYEVVRPNDQADLH